MEKVTNVFEENYELNSEDGSGDEVSDADDEFTISDEYNLSISVGHARRNYDAAGTLVDENKETITVKEYAHLISEKVDDLLDKVVEETKLPYMPVDFQRVAVNVLGSLKSLILISPTGSGKMSVPLLAILVLRKLLGNDRGICIVTQPLTSIMNEKLNNIICPAAVLSMSGELKTSSSFDEDDEERAVLSCGLDELLSGAFPVMFCHGESVETPLGRHILKELQKRDMLLLICIDEFHQGGEGHWKSFRPSMMSSSSSLRKVNQIQGSDLFKADFPTIVNL